MISLSGERIHLIKPVASMKETFAPDLKHPVVCVGNKTNEQSFTSCFKMSTLLKDHTALC